MDCSNRVDTPLDVRPLRTQSIGRPEKIYGTSEHIRAIARTGFSKEHPFAAELLGNIHLTDRQISSLMSAIEQTRGTEREAVREWIKQNRALVDSWIPKDKETKMYKYDYRRLRV